MVGLPHQNPAVPPASKPKLILLACISMITLLAGFQVLQHYFEIENAEVEPPIEVENAGEDTKKTEITFDEVLKWTNLSRDAVAELEEYGCTFTKREREKGKLGPYQTSQMKLRHEPFSVYMKSTAPKDEYGQQVIYVEGENDGRMIAHGAGMKKALGTMRLELDSFLAGGSTITEAGMLHMITVLADRHKKDPAYLEGTFRTWTGVKVGDRPCRCIELTYPNDGGAFTIAESRLYIDEETHFPLRYERRDWTEKSDTETILIKEYLYSKIKVNPGFTDEDFDYKNSEYGFPPIRLGGK